MEKVNDHKSILAKIAFKLNATEFYGWKVINSDTKGTFIAPPSEQYDDNGEKKYRPLIKFPAELMKTVSEQLLQSWDNWK